MLKFENVANTGDIIRAYDFQPMDGRAEYYIEGEVVGTIDEPYKAFIIRVTRDHQGGKDVQTRVGGEVLVPMEVDFLEYDGRVTNLTNQ